MNELHRQEYLSLIGIEQYIPRWRIPFAAESNPLEIINLNQDFSKVHPHEMVNEKVETNSPELRVNNSDEPLGIASLLDDFQAKQTFRKNQIENRSQVSEQKNSSQLQPFTLNVWRPESGFLILASRNFEAMPTELLLNNFLKFYLKNPRLQLSEEFLRWPAATTSQILPTETAAKTELQTWLNVQHEIQPINKIWFFGYIHCYFMEEAAEIKNTVNSRELILDQSINSKASIKATILPELSQFLLQPSLKAELLSLE